MTKKEGIDFIKNFYRHTLYNKKDRIYLLTVDDGNFIFLNESSFNQLKKGKIVDEIIYNKLLEKGIIVNNSNFDNVVEKTKKRYQFLMNGTSLHIVIPTSRCNLGCTYCFATPDPIDASKEDHDLSEETGIQIINFIMNSPSESVTIEFQGGEAIARFDLVKQMAIHAKKLNQTLKKDLKLTIVSNLTLMTDEIADFLVTHDITVCTSLDGPKVVHNKNRFIHAKSGKEIGTYDRVVYWVKRINGLCKEKNKTWKVNALMTITKHSLPYYKEIIDEYLNLDLEFLDIRCLTIVGKAVDNSIGIHYSFGEFSEFYKNSLNYIRELKQKGIKVDERTRLLFETKVLENTPTYHTDYESPCGAATGQIVYHSNGDIYTCHESLGRDEFKLGNVFSDEWENLFEKEEAAKAILNSMLEANVKCDRCVYKPYCGTCMVENFYHFGKFNYYPTKTSKHHETIMQCNQIFDDIYKEVKKTF